MRLEAAQIDLRFRNSIGRISNVLAFEHNPLRKPLCSYPIRQDRDCEGVESSMLSVVIALSLEKRRLYHSKVICSGPFCIISTRDLWSLAYEQRKRSIQDYCDCRGHSLDLVIRSQRACTEPDRRTAQRWMPVRRAAFEYGKAVHALQQCTDMSMVVVMFVPLDEKRKNSISLLIAELVGLATIPAAIHFFGTFYINNHFNLGSSWL